MKNIFTILILASLSGLAYYSGANEQHPLAERSVYEVELSLGAEPSSFQVDPSIPNVSAEVGKDLVHMGFSKREDSKKSKRQSKHFVCTSCHNVEQEDLSLQAADAMSRLNYAATHDKALLQGTTLYGAVNRETFYNGDYVKKYGDLVKPAHADIREAIQLCAVECAQGRELKDWEVESILAYLWTIDLKMGDLGLSETEFEYINKAIETQEDTEQVLRIIQGLYMNGSPATFGYPPEDRKKGYADLEGDPNRGKLIYEKSCYHCHANQRYSYFNLDDSSLSYKFLDKKAGSYSRYSLYQVIRYGTYPLHGKKSYMPLYTEEKMSDQMIEDLRAYIEKKAD